MNKILSKIATALMLGVLCFSILPTAYAEQQSVKLSIPVSVSVTGNPQEDAEVFDIILSPDDESYPLPDSSDSNVFDLKITGENSSSFDINYSRVGIYNYKIYQQAGNNQQLRYDDTKYNLTVYVTNDEQNQLKVSAILHSDKEDGKPESVEFVNRIWTVLPNHNIKDSDSDSDSDVTSEVVSETTSENTASENPKNTSSVNSDSSKNQTVQSTVLPTSPKTAVTVSTEPNNTSSVSNNPFKTGDEHYTIFLAAVMLISVLRIAASIAAKKKQD